MGFWGSYDVVVPTSVKKIEYISDKARGKTLYRGTQEQWEAIEKVEPDSENWKNIDIVYNYKEN